MVSETVSSAAPRAEYSRRVEELSVERSGIQRRERLVGYVQLGLGAVLCCLFRPGCATSAESIC